MKSSYKKGENVLANDTITTSIANPVVTKRNINNIGGLCPKKNYFKNSEEYIFLNGTVRSCPRERQFNMYGVT